MSDPDYEITLVRRIVCGFLMLVAYSLGSIVGAESSRVPFVVSDQPPLAGEMMSDVVGRLGPPIFQWRHGDGLRCQWRIRLPEGDRPVAYAADIEDGKIVSIVSVRAA